MGQVYSEANMEGTVTVSNGTSSGWWTYPTYQEGVCPGCGGARVQRRNDGINVICPVCNGSGYYTYYDYPQIQPWTPYEPYYVTTTANY